MARNRILGGSRPRLSPDPRRPRGYFCYYGHSLYDPPGIPRRVSRNDTGTCLLPRWNAPCNYIYYPDPRLICSPLGSANNCYLNHCFLHNASASPRCQWPYLDASQFPYDLSPNGKHLENFDDYDNVQHTFSPSVHPLYNHDQMPVLEKASPHSDHYFNGHIAMESFPQEILNWDLFKGPDYLALGRDAKRRRILEQPISYPTVRELQLTFTDESNNSTMNQLAAAWGPIIVTPRSLSSMASNRFFRSVVVADLLEAVYQYFMTPLTPEETMALVNETSHTYSQISLARLLRLEAYDHQDDKGNRWRTRQGYNADVFVRADILNGCVRLMGLEASWWDDCTRTAGGVLFLKKRDSPA